MIVYLDTSALVKLYINR